MAVTFELLELGISFLVHKYTFTKNAKPERLGEG